MSEERPSEETPAPTEASAPPPPPRPQEPLGRLVLQRTLATLSSFKLAVSILVLMLLLTWFGTLQQVHESLYDVQHRYFDSWFVVHYLRIDGLDFQPGVPLPGGMLLMSLLFLNLVVGGIIRMRRWTSQPGVLVTHLGIGFLLLSGFVKYNWADEGSVVIFEGDRQAAYQAHHYWELAVSTPDPGGKARVWSIPWDDLRDLGPDDRRMFRHAALPFTLEVYGFRQNCVARPVGPMAHGVSSLVVDGFTLAPRERDKERAERNRPGCFLRVLPQSAGSKSVETVLWDAGNPSDRYDRTLPFTTTVEGRRYDIVLRKETRPLPFELELAEFRHVRHPRSSVARAYESDVVARADGVDPQKVTISMNRPLRRDGLVVYQSGFFPDSAEYRGPMASIFSVASNPADQWPKWACYVIAIGMLWHFGAKLMAWTRKERARRSA
ncbi:MAG: cytochrome c biogenesis protein ResB [Planctomycetota bacterium]